MNSVTFFSLCILVLSALSQCSVYTFTARNQAGHAPSRRSSSALPVAPMTPMELIDSSSILLAKNEVLSTVAAEITSHTTSRSADLVARILSDGSNVIGLLPSLQTRKSSSTVDLRTRYAQFLGRLLAFSEGFLPHHEFPTEEVVVQLFLIGSNAGPILRSIRLYRCIANRKKQECALAACEADEISHDSDPSIR
mmetsp:Transcript_23520/g.65281  ORF Transcript_23520/g.65281 Transcript_23520/m.65281 type:complete len:195 (+) Transcript_23520:294-878(+)|eukprot:CAMPEP_0172375994 /NCGR_PEP_ID=MMETSP1060-20121228/64554_1 /TAXON_ID=37318 /ORGANISM="Pseudo-nitzschia pungens, Strain cf. cingulata" /LENGTH=194 /DNA_ID=CAMNT_0013103345 /DNA_START=207 /DNA_END=791 /DNA_ORIENTATION=-